MITEYLETPRAMPDHEAMDECSEWAVSSFARSAAKIPPIGIVSISAWTQGEVTARECVGEVL